MKLAAFGRGGLLKPMEAVIQEMEAAQVPFARCIVREFAGKAAKAHTTGAGASINCSVSSAHCLWHCCFRSAARLPYQSLGVYVCDSGFAKQVPWTRQTFNGIMNAYAEQGNTQRCRELCKRMEQEGIPPDEVTFSTILRSYAYVLRPPFGSHRGSLLPVHTQDCRVAWLQSCNSLLCRPAAEHGCCLQGLGWSRKKLMQPVGGCLQAQEAAG